MRAYVRDQRRSHWAWFQHAVLDDYVEQGLITTTDFTIYCALCRFANNDGASWPSTETLGKKAGVGPRTAQRSIQKLQDVGLIEIERRRDDLGRDLSSVYVLLEPSREGVMGAPYPVTDDAPRVSGMTREGVMGAPEQEPRELEPENKKNGRHRKTMTPEQIDDWLKRAKRAGTDKLA